MQLAVLLARYGVAAILALAASAKAFSVGETASAAIQFGLPEGLARPLSYVLPASEISIAAALVGGETAHAGVVGATVLTASFLAVTGQAVLRRRPVSCHCFGHLSQEPISAKTVARNAALFGVTATVAWATLADRRPPGVAYTRLSGTQWAVVGLAVGVGVLAAVFWRTTTLLLQQQGRLLLRLDELGRRAPLEASPPADTALSVGEPAPSFALAGSSGETVTLDSLVGLGRPLLMVFSDARCGPCHALLPTVAHWQRNHTVDFTTVVISAGTPEESARQVSDHGLVHAVFDVDRSVAASYRVSATPSAILVGLDGRLATKPAVGAPTIEAMVGQLLHRPTIMHEPDRGPSREAPAFALPAVGGEAVTHRWFTQRASSVVLFWNPSCGFCQGMQPRLEAWDDRNPGDGLLVISAGGSGIERQLQIRAPILLDDGRVTAAFGATGTPMAVVVDGDGRISSQLAAGEEAVFSMLERSRLAI